MSTKLPSNYSEVLIRGVLQKVNSDFISFYHFSSVQIYFETTVVAVIHEYEHILVEYEISEVEMNYRVYMLRTPMLLYAIRKCSPTWLVDLNPY